MLPFFLEMVGKEISFINQIRLDDVNEKTDLTKPACIIIIRIQTLTSVTNYWLKISSEFLKGL